MWLSVVHPARSQLHKTLEANMSLSRRIVILFFPISAVVSLFLSCSSDEDGLRPSPPSANMIQVDFENARVIEVDSDRHWALLLHSGEGSPGTAIQLVDLVSRTLTASRILTDYLDVYDIAFVGDDEACFAGRLHGHIGYAVHFFSLSSLTLGTRVLFTSDTSGNPGFLDVDSSGSFVYYSHAGGGNNDGLYKIRVSNKQIVDADNDGLPPFAFDNDLAAGLFASPGRLLYDDAAATIVVANPFFITMINSAVWGTLDRADNLNWYDPPVNATHLSTSIGANADMMAFGANAYVFGGASMNQPTLSLFRVVSQALDLQVSLPHVSWWRDNSAIAIHPREDIVSAFVLYEDSAGVAVGQYRLNNLVEVTASPYRTHQIPDTSISTFGLDIVSDKLIIADSHEPRLELISIE